ncbi:MAG: hypothetical protein KKD44_26580 [Proteobacteria bacterium]|nr:hypothetical protein [Pseudomonadota bacterium]
MSAEKTRQVNIGKLPQEVKDDIDNAIDSVCILLREHGQQIIPGYMLKAAAILNWLHPYKDLDSRQAKERAVQDVIDRMQKFKKDYFSEAEAEKSV